MEYKSFLSNRDLRTLDWIQGLLGHLRNPGLNIDALLKDAAELIWRQFGIDNVAIGLKDPSDGLYRYRTMVGFKEGAIEGHRQIAYRREQFYRDSEFKGTDISQFSRLYLQEDNEPTEAELRAFNRPSLMNASRRTLADSLEGDYIDTKILGSGDDLLGWIELSGTKTMKLPDAMTIRWVEVIASIVGAALVSQAARMPAIMRKSE